MPNWCYNKVQIHFDDYNEEKLREVLHEEKELFNQLLTRPKEYDEGERWYGWNIQHWGTKWDAEPRGIEWGEGSVTFTMDTAWAPPIEFFKYIEEAYGYSVELYYQEEGMCFLGRYCDGEDEYYEYADMSIDAMRDELPEWVEDEFGLISRAEDDAEDQRQQEEFEFEAQLEKTEWYPGKIKPFRDGLYQVKTKQWPWEHKDTWEDGAWLSGNKITEWRGITEQQHFDIVLKELNDMIDATIASDDEMVEDNE